MTFADTNQPFILQSESGAFSPRWLIGLPGLLGFRIDSIMLSLSCNTDAGLMPTLAGILRMSFHFSMQPLGLCLASMAWYCPEHRLADLSWSCRDMTHAGIKPLLINTCARPVSTHMPHAHCRHFSKSAGTLHACSSVGTGRASLRKQRGMLAASMHAMGAASSKQPRLLLPGGGIACISRGRTSSPLAWRMHSKT